MYRTFFEGGCSRGNVAGPATEPKVQNNDILQITIDISTRVSSYASIQ